MPTTNHHENAQSILTELIDPSKLYRHPDNPRAHSKKQIHQIAKSIETFGFRFPVLVDGDYRLICGHGRVEAAKILNMESIPVLMADDLDDHQVRALMIADNRLTENSSWDVELLGQNLMILDELELNFDIEVTGFDYGEIQQFMLNSIDDDEEKYAQPPLPVVPQHPVCQLGDLWQVGPHRLLCADSLDSNSYQQLLGDEVVDIVLTDPPYNLPAKTIGKVAEKKHGNFDVAAGEMNTDEFISFLSRVFDQLVEVSKSGSLHYIFMDWRHIHEVLSAANKYYSEYKNLCVWTKDVPGMGSFYRSQHELVFVFKNGHDPHTNNIELGQYGRNRSNVWPYKSARHLNSSDGDVQGHCVLNTHPTVKPVKLLEDVLLDSSRKHEIVLDPFLGSGSTLIAAEKTHRQCRAIELSPHYVDVAIRRWQQWTNQDVKHGPSGRTFNDLYEASMHEKEI